MLPYAIYRMAAAISKMGFVFSEQGLSKILVPVCVSISICCSATGFVYQVCICKFLLKAKIIYTFYKHLQTILNAIFCNLFILTWYGNMATE